MSLRPFFLASAAALAFCVSARATTFGLEGEMGATPTFSVSADGNTATFSSTAGNGFAVQDTTGLLTFSTALLDNNFFGTDPLTISFATPVAGELIIPFAVLDAYGTTDSLTITANTGQTATFAAFADALALGEPEGVAGFSLAAPTSSVTLTATNAFAIGGVSAVTPEPASIALVLSGGLAGIAGLRRRRTL